MSIVDDCCSLWSIQSVALATTMNHVIFAPAPASNTKFNSMNISLLKKPFPQLRALAILIAVVVLSHPANAQITYTWSQATVGANNWNVAGNWSSTGGTFPGSLASDIAVFGNTGVASAATTVN